MTWFPKEEQRPWARVSGRNLATGHISLLDTEEVLGPKSAKELCTIASETHFVLYPSCSLEQARVTDSDYYLGLSLPPRSFRE